MNTNTSPEEFSPEAVSLATLAVVHRVIDRLVEREIMTSIEADQLFVSAAAEQQLLGLPGNQEAAALLAHIAKERARKFR